MLLVLTSRKRRHFFDECQPRIFFFKNTSLGTHDRKNNTQRERKSETGGGALVFETQRNNTACETKGREQKHRLCAKRFFVG